MVILHIACLNNDLASGVDLVVPLHIIKQSDFASTALINVAGVKIESIKNQFLYKPNLELSDLPSPFNHPDIVVFHETYRFQYLKLYRQLLNGKIPYIIVPHGELNSSAQRKGWLKKKIANLFFFKGFINSALAIQTLSLKEKETTKFRPLKFVSTNGVLIPSCEKQSFNTNKIIFSYIGRLSIYNKGLDLLLEAIYLKKAFLKSNHCEFHLYGPPSTNNTIKRIVRMIKKYKVEDIVFLHNAVYGEEKYKVLQLSDVFIQTSRSEGMPTGLLEALAFGMPCLITVGTSLGELVSNNDCGWVANIDVKSISSLLETAVNDKAKFLAKSKNSKQLIANNFDWETIAYDTINAYKNLISKKQL